MSGISGRSDVMRKTHAEAGEKRRPIARDEASQEGRDLSTESRQRVKRGAHKGDSRDVAQTRRYSRQGDS